MMDVVRKENSKAELEPGLNVNFEPKDSNVKTEVSKVKAEDIEIKQERINIKTEKNVAIKSEPGLPAIEADDVKTKNEAVIGTVTATDDSHRLAFLKYKEE